MTDGAPPRRRSGLLQERSRRTRQRLVRAALELWTRRGFETGIEETTVEEIVQAAGVTKGTFYFHFARKEQILLEMGWDTAALVYEESMRCLEAGRSIDDSVGRVMNGLARRIKAAPPAAVARSAAEFRRAPRGELDGTDRVTFTDGFSPLFERAQEEGEVTAALEPVEMAQMLEALVMDSIMDWAVGQVDLSGALRRRSTILLAGLSEWPGAG